MFISFIGLFLASTVSAKVIDIQVGGDAGALTFTPEAIVSVACHDIRFAAIDKCAAVRRCW